jgi:hypothetical protein
MSENNAAAASAQVDSVEHCSQTHARISAKSPMIKIIGESPERKTMAILRNMIKSGRKGFDFSRQYVQPDIHIQELNLKISFYP